MLLASRFITGVGVGMEVVIVPLFQSEVSHYCRSECQTDTENIDCTTSCSRIHGGPARGHGVLWICDGWLVWIRQLLCIFGFIPLAISARRAMCRSPNLNNRKSITSRISSLAYWPRTTRPSL
jgi:hypothetical protein